MCDICTIVANHELSRYDISCTIIRIKYTYICRYTNIQKCKTYRDVKVSENYTSSMYT